MDEKFELHSKFQLEGIFWDAANPDDKFAGTLSCDGRRLELNTRAELVTPTPEMFMGSDEASVPDIVHGFTVKGDCSIIGLQHINTPGLLDYPRERGVRWRSFRVIGACLMGWHLANDTAEVLTAADVTYTGISEWFPGCGASITWPEGATLISLPKERRTVLDVCILAKRFHLLIDIDPNFEFKMGGRSFKADSEPVIMLEPAEPRSLQWFVEVMHRLENFLSLCLGSSVRAKTMRLIGKDDKTESGWLIRPRGGKIEKPSIAIWLRCDSSQLSSAVASWFSMSEEFTPLENLIYGTIRHSSLFVETEFLSLAQAIESFHRLTDTSTIVEPEVFAQVQETLLGFISQQIWANSAIADRCKEALNFLNDPTFKTRIHSLLAGIDPERLKTLVGDQVIFEQTLKQTRNYLTHPGIEKKGKVLTGSKELFLFNQKLHVLLRLLMLKTLGFSEEAIFDQMFQQSRRYS
jgi:ApeA N-terminal domain 1